MYHMKTIVPIDDNITLPQCMYYIKNPNNTLKMDEIEINISDQVMRFLKGVPNNKMIELEQRQNQLLLKLDVLYERIKTISSMCKLNVQRNTNSVNVEMMPNPKEIVIVLNPEILPWFLNVFLKDSPGLNISWHIHSSVPSEKGSIIRQFFKRYQELYPAVFDVKVNFRMIFKCVPGSAELRMSPLEVPLLGLVNILRYLCLLYPNVIPYDQNDYYVDSLLDLCHLLEKTSRNHKEEIVSKIFSHCKNWIYKNELSVVDLAAYIVIKWQNITKSVPKNWYTKCESKFS